MTNTTVEAPVTAVNEVQPAVEAAPKKRASRSRKKVVAPVVEESKAPEMSEEKRVDHVTEPLEAPAAPEEKEEAKARNERKKAPQKPTQVENKKEEAKPEPVENGKAADNSKPVQNDNSKPAPAENRKPEPKPIPKMPSNLVVRDFCDLANYGSRIPLLSDQQIQQLTYEDAVNRNLILEAIICNVLDYDIVLSDTNIWLELLIGHTSSHSDPRVNARLMFERQLEFISRMMKRIGGKFMIMSETYEEVDRFATQQEPTNYKDADWKDEALCRNVAARLAKRLMLSQQKENRLRIEGIGSESHHAAFADPAIIRRTVELFAQGKKVLLLTNDASVGIRSLGMCDDLQRTNNVDDKTWREVYEPQRPMVLTMDDLKLLDQYTRQYHFTQVAAGRGWMQDVQMREPAVVEMPLELWLEGFRPGDRHESRSARQEQQRREQERKEAERKEQERREAERKEQQRLEQERREAEKAARREEQERREAEKAARREEQERREAQRRAEKERAAAERERQAAEKKAAEAARKVSQENMPQEAPAEPVDAENAAPVQNSIDNGPEVSAPVAVEAVAPVNTEAAENSEVAAEPMPISLPPLSAEAMELIGGNTASEKKSRTRRGGRRKSNNKKAEA